MYPLKRTIVCQSQQHPLTIIEFLPPHTQCLVYFPPLKLVMNFKCAFFQQQFIKHKANSPTLCPVLLEVSNTFAFISEKTKQNKTKVNLTAILLTFSVLHLIYNKVVQSSKIHNLRNKLTIVLIFIYSKCIFAKQDTDVNDSHSVHNV